MNFTLKTSIRLWLCLATMFCCFLEVRANTNEEDLIPNLQNASTFVRVDSARGFYDRLIKHSDSLTAETLLNGLLLFAKEKNYRDIECYTYSLMASKWARTRSPNLRSDEFHKKSVAMAQTYGLKELAVLLRFSFGLYQLNSKRIADGIYEMLVAREIAGQIGAENIPFYGEHLYHLGRAYYDLGDLIEAHPIIEESVNYGFLHSFYLMQAHNTLAVIDAKRGKFKEAIMHNLHAQNTEEFEHNIFWQALLQSNLGRYYLDQKMPDSARYFGIKGLETIKSLREISRDNINLKAMLLVTLVNASEKLNIAEAEKWLAQLRPLLPEVTEVAICRKIARIQADYLAGRGEKEAAILFYQQAMIFGDSLRAQENRNAEFSAQTRSEVERKVALKQEKERADKAYASLKFFSITGIAALSFAIVAMLVFQYRKRS